MNVTSTVGGVLEITEGGVKNEKMSSLATIGWNQKPNPDWWETVEMQQEVKEPLIRTNAMN